VHLAGVTEGFGGEDFAREIGLGRNMAKMTIVTNFFQLDKVFPYEYNVVEIFVTDVCG
jgi:hypothetical protein